MSRTQKKTPRQLVDDLERLNKRIYDRLSKGKPVSKLVNGKKTKIPGFSYYFRRSK